jgi:hypothetical protein
MSGTALVFKTFEGISMTSLAGQLMLAGLLALVGAGLWTTANLDRGLADGAQELATLQYERASATLGEPAGGLLRRLPGVAAAADRADTIRETALYWQGAPGSRTALLAANDAYHATMEAGGTWQTVVAKLDEVVKQYAAVVREHPEDEDAAFNYEFVVRLRAGIAAGKRDIAANQGGSDVTIHGVPGAPPEGSDMKTFKMIVPMQPDERREAEQAGRGAARVRKG